MNANYDVEKLNPVSEKSQSAKQSRILSGQYTTVHGVSNGNI